MALTDWLKDRWADVNVFDGGKSAASIRASKKPVQNTATLPDTSAPRPVQRQAPKQVKILQPPKQSFWNKVGDVFEGNSEADMYRRQQAGLPQDIKQQSNISRVSRALETGGRSLARAAQGVGQDVGGAYDLLTPGKGTNRITKMYKERGARTDKQVKDMNLDPNAYRAGQVAPTVASYLVPGKVVEGVSKVPTVARGVEAASSVVNKVPGVARVAGTLDDLTVNGNAAQRVASRLVRSYTKPAAIADVVGDTFQNAGHRTSMGQDNNFGTVAADAGMSLLTQGGVDLASQGAKAGSRLVTTPLRNANLIRPINLNPDEAAALSRFQDARKGLYEMDDATYQNGRAAALKAGIDYRDPQAVDSVVGAMRNYDVKKGNRKENLLALKENLDKNASLGMASKPVDANGNPTSNFQPRPLKERVASLKEEVTARLPDKNEPRQIPDFSDPAVQFPAQKKSKFANTTVQNSDEVSDPLKKMVREENVQYTPTTNEGRIKQADDYLKGKSNDDAFTEVIQRFENTKAVNDQDIVTGIQLAKKLDASGTEADMFKASELFDNLSRTLTEKGQAVQAASLLSARTPQGLLYTAQKNLRKNGVEVTPAIQQELKDLIDKVKKQKPGTYEDGLARFNVMDYVSKKVPSSNTSKALQIWKAGLLSAPRTTAGNLAANTAETVFKKGYVDPLATGLDAVMSIFTRKRSRSLTGRGLASGFGEGVGKGVKYFKTGYDPRNPMTKFDVRDIHFSDTVKGRAAEKYTQTIFRLMGAQDQPFYYANLRNSLADQAITEAKNKGLKGDARDAFVKTFITEPDTKAMALADKEARYAVFQNETALGKAASRLKGAEGATGNVAEFVMPFSGVPSSVATRMIERTPIGTATEIVKQIRSGKFDQRAMTQAIANGTVVIPLLGVGKALADNSMITLGYPKDQTERDLWELEGKQPYSIKVGGKWRSMNYFQPAGTLIAAGAEYAQKIKDGGSPSEALAVAAAGGGKALTEQSFLKGVSGALGAITDPQTAGERFLEQTAGSTVPNFLRSVANATDKVKRDQDNLAQTVMAGIPGLRQKLPERNNIYGDAIPNVASTGEIALDPTKPSRILGNDPVTQELRRLKDVDQGVTTIKLTNTKDMKFTDAQKRDFEKQTGQEVKKQWETIIKDPRYQELDDENRKKILRDAAETINGARKRQFMADNNIGEYAQDFKGKPSKLDTAQKRLLKGGTVDYLNKNDKEKTFAEDYEDKLTKFKEDEKSLSPVERTKRQKELRQLKVKKDFDEDTVSLYGMSKAEAYDFLSSDDNGSALAKKMLAYGDALVAAGLAKTNKFRDKKGRESIEPKETGSGGRSKRISAADFKVYTGSANPLALSAQLRKLLAGAKIG